jgi:hypothetical protein
MMEILPTASEGVVAIRYRGKISRAEIDRSIALIEASLDAREQTHCYIEVEDFSGFETEGMGDHLKAAGRFLKKLDRFGRIAVVADQDWLRWAAKAESAILPKVSYETFTSDERERALAWVEGREARPHGSAIKIIETSRPDVLGFELDGKAGKEELDAVTAHFNAKLEGDTPLRMFGRLKRIGGFEMSGLWNSDYFAMKRGFVSRLERYAIVGGPAWVRTTANMMQPLLKVEIRHFKADEEARAWEWLGAEIVSERPVLD